MPIATEDPGALRERFAARDQGHVFRFWDRLTPAERRQLTAQLAALDLDALAAAFAHGRRPAVEALLEPPEVVRRPARGGDPALLREARARGEEELAAGRVAALVVAGGQGTRLGHPGPKGTFPLGPVTDRSLFGLQAEKLRGLARRYGRPVPWYVMTSPATDAATRAFFADRGHFGLEPEDVFFFCQQEVACLDLEGRLMLESPASLARSPDGHGGVIPALAASGALEDLRRRGIRTVSYYQVDNPLVRIGDPVLIGLQRLRGAEMTVKVVSKREPGERVGTLARCGGALRVIEYTEIREPLRSRRDPSGELAFWAGAIGIHAIDVAFLGRAAARAERWLPHHLSPKRIPTLDAAGRPIRPAEPNGYKLERFVFDALPHAVGAALEVVRQEEYSPVKNAHGGESPATGRRDLSACARRWLERAGVAAPPAGLDIELDHARIDGEDDLRALGIRHAAEAGDAVRTGTGGTP